MASDGNKLKCPRCCLQLLTANLESHLRQELAFYSWRCGLCLVFFLSRADAVAHFDEPSNPHRGMLDLLLETEDATKRAAFALIHDEALARITVEGHIPLDMRVKTPKVPKKELAKVKEEKPPVPQPDTSYSESEAEEEDRLNQSDLDAADDSDEDGVDESLQLTETSAASQGPAVDESLQLAESFALSHGDASELTAPSDDLSGKLSLSDSDADQSEVTGDIELSLTPFGLSASEIVNFASPSKGAAQPGTSLHNQPLNISTSVAPKNNIAAPQQKRKRPAKSAKSLDQSQGASDTAAEFATPKPKKQKRKSSKPPAPPQFDVLLGSVTYDAQSFYHCSLCAASMGGREVNLQRHAVSCHTALEPFACAHCPVRTKEATKIRRHLREMHHLPHPEAADFRLESAEEVRAALELCFPPPDGSPRLRCGCGADVSRYAAWDHVAVAHLKKVTYTCRLCPFKARVWSRGLARNHMESRHGRTLGPTNHASHTDFLEAEMSRLVAELFPDPPPGLVPV